MKEDAGMGRWGRRGRGDAGMGRRGEKERLSSESQLFPPIPLSSFPISSCKSVPVSPCPLVPIPYSL
ncbi:hypothetical protein [Trichormus sp. NMC-1]|uniref:hypothetical protein n=1 Tax=Trichormus sp. NMC-1 TaxID=1853259 RepID=UPI0015A61EE6|nr:hypothetical protein [Trichormus sp. NMC-1]